MAVIDEEMKKTRRIAVVGAGAVGSYYGGRLWEGASLRSDDHYYQQPHVY